MKTAGIVLFVLAVWLMSVVWYDSSEGVVLRPVAFLGGVVGGVLFVIGIRNDLIKEIRKNDFKRPGP